MELQNQDKEYWFSLITDRLTGSISDEADTQLARWRKASDDNERIFVELQKMWQALSLSHRNEDFDEQRAFRMFKERVDAETRAAKQIPMRRYRTLKRIASYAAILIPVVVLSYFTYRYFATTSEKSETPLLSEITVPNGSKTQLSLQDGTKVWVNAGSQIRYDSDFGKTNRTIALSGEAYFEVAKDEHSPFIVRIGAVKVKVLGTRFNVNAYEENNGVIVALSEGSVEMNTEKGDSVILKPGDVARYTAITGQIAVLSDIPGNSFAWTDNKLIFGGETFEQIIRKLERNFNVRVYLRNEQIKNRRFVGDFVNNETIEQIFTVMSVNGKFRYTIKGNVIDIY